MGEEKTFEFATVRIDKQQTYDKKTRTPWRSGEEYMGCALEVYQNGRLLTFKLIGDSKVRKAYEAMKGAPVP